MDDKSNKIPSLLDYRPDEINIEMLQPDNSKNINSISNTSNEKKLTINLNNNSNETDNCDDMLKAFNDAFETIYGDNEVSFIQAEQISKELQTNCLHLINKIYNQKKDFIEIGQLRSMYNLLENESLTTINNLQCQIIQLKLQLKQQSTFSSIIGSIFGYYLWKATQIPNVVNIVLQEDKLIHMAKIMASIIFSFIETFNNKMPSIKTYETKCVLNILGIVANLTISKTGRHFFSQINDGINVINLIVSLVLCIPSSLKNSLKKIAYAALYNVSIQCNGHLLMENNKLIEIVYNDIKTISFKNISDVSLFALKLLHSLTRNINESMYTIFKNSINLQEILVLTRYTETELLARKIYENLNILNEKFKNKF